MYIKPKTWKIIEYFGEPSGCAVVSDIVNAIYEFLESDTTLRLEYFKIDEFITAAASHTLVPFHMA